MKQAVKIGWEAKPLGDVCKFTGGGTPSKQNPSFWGGDIPWVSPKDMKSDVVSDSMDHVTDIAVEQSAAKRIPEGAILIVVRSGILARTIPVAIAGRELTVNQDLKAIIPDKRLERRFLAYYFQAVEPQLLDRVTRGATVHKLDMPVIKSLPVPLPTLEEQQRIVAVLDEAFEGLARARSHAEANLQNARELFTSLLDEVFAQEDWPEFELLELANDNCSLSYGIVQPGDDVQNGLSIVRPVDLGGSVVKLEGLKRIDPDRASSYARTQLDGTDLLLCVRGTTGTISLSSEELAGANVTRGIVPIRFNERMMRLFGYFQFQAGYVQRQIAEKTYGAALMQINIKDVKKLRLKCPPQEKQAVAVRRMENISEAHSILMASAEKKVADIDDLRQSLLQEAFAGELT